MHFDENMYVRITNEIELFYEMDTHCAKSMDSKYPKRIPSKYDKYAV